MLADLAMRAGRRVVVFDLFGDLDLRRSASRVVTRGDLTALVDAAVAEPPGAVVYGASFENHPALVDRLGERHTLLGNPPATLRAVRDPVRLGAALGDLPYPRTSDTAPSSGRWLRKPLRGGGGIRVQEWRGGAPRAGTFLQERIDGVPCSAAAVGDGKDAVVLGLTEQLVGRARVRRPRLPLVRERRPAARAGRRAARPGARGLLPRGGRVRASAGCSASTSSGTASARGRSRSTRARPRRSRRSRRRTGPGCSTRTCAPAPASCLRRAEPLRAAGKAVLFATEDVTVRDTERWLERGVRDVPHPGERIAAGRPVCTVVTTAATPDEVAGRARAGSRAAAGGAARGGGGGWLTRRARAVAACATTSR